MQRILTILTATVVAAAPALALGVAVPAQAGGTLSSRQVQSLDDKGGHHQAEPGDDKGRHGGREAEPGDDSRARPAAARPVTIRTVATVARADDKGGKHEAEPGDDKGGRHAEPGDDKGRR